MSFKDKVVEKVMGAQMQGQVEKLTKHLESIDAHLESIGFKMNELVTAYNGIEKRLEVLEK